MMKRLTLETKKSIAQLLVNTALQRIINEKREKVPLNPCKETKQVIFGYIESNPI
jgi:ribosomal protein S7